jgi:hypothetical protein
VVRDRCTWGLEGRDARDERRPGHGTAVEGATVFCVIAGWDMMVCRTVTITTQHMKKSSQSRTETSFSLVSCLITDIMLCCIPTYPLFRPAKRQLAGTNIAAKDTGVSRLRADLWKVRSRRRPGLNCTSARFTLHNVRRAMLNARL